MHPAVSCLLLSLLLVACSPRVTTDAASPTGTPAASEAPASADAQSKQAAVDAVFAEMVKPGEPGAAVGVYEKGKLVYSKGYGMADLDLAVPVTAETVFNLASVSKQFTAFAVALLEQEGKINPQDDIRRYLPNMPELETPVTVADLVHHLSGLRDYMALGALSGHDNDSLIRQSHIAQILERQKGVDFTAGTGYSYSNSGYVLLADIVAAASGMPFAQFMQERVFGPLGMNDTRVRHDLADLQPGYATGYVPADDGWRRAVYNRIALGPGNVLSTVGDLAKWAGNFTNPVVGDRALIDRLALPAKLRDGTPVNYGYGLRQETMGGYPIVTHSGGISGFNTNFAYFPEQDFAVVVLANRPFDADGATQKVQAIYLPSKAEPEPAADATAAQPAAAPTATLALAGNYAGANGPVLTLQQEKDGFTVKSLGRDARPLRFWSDGSFGVGEYGGSRYRAVTGDGGAVVALESIGSTDNINSNRVVDRLERVQPAPSTPTGLETLAGDYRSDEIDATYRLSVESGRVILRSLWLNGSQPMVATAPDRFESDSGPLQGLRFSVERSASGEPVALTFRYGSLKGVRLDRVRR